ncbi:zeta toxin family protein [Cupriavidus gilardii]|jgi:predicted ABC-type ATPase|uniref:zeta toxin family protein n=1 Tax=Cupriavidus gilardii TaxID=82541 RepID=UPI001580820F|nr:zeta toxin family protein [Cupriavidus gilardii]MCT9074836.1 zeta toxin family protein [Cupriavidus gilardii]QKS64728.1 zeta toxin family protein [Cupriavidus gilardii]
MTDTENKNESTVICFAGPNGSGKSTAIIEVVEDYGLPPEAYINADDIAKSLEGEIFDYRERNLRAAEIAEQRRLAALESGKDFAFETVMSTPEKVALLTQAKAKGYEVALIFVSTNDPEINVARVANRVALGGHAVDPDAVRDRYRRAHDLLACAVEHADAALVHDNSATNAQHVVVARKFEGEVQFFSYAERDTSWATNALERPWRERVASRSELLSVMVERAVERGEEPPAEPKWAEAFNGADYMGLVLSHTDHHVLQLNAKGEYVLHDRQLLATDVIKDGAWQCLQYRYAKGKIDRAGLLAAAVPEEKGSQRPKL